MHNIYFKLLIKCYIIVFKNMKGKEYYKYMKDFLSLRKKLFY